MKKSFNRLIRRVASGALAAAAVLTAAAGAFPAGRAFAAEYADSPDGYSADSLPSYREYRSIYADRSRPETAVVLTAADAVGTVRKYTDYEGRKGEALYTDETDTAAFEFEVSESGLYHLLFEYYPAEGNGGAIERTVAIDGAVPFQEAENLSFSRIWANASGEVKEDIQGNQILIEQVETPRWTTQYAIDPSGIATEPLAFYLEAGSHTLTVEGVMEPMVIGSISFLPLVRRQCKSTAHKALFSNISHAPPDCKGAHRPCGRSPLRGAPRFRRPPARGAFWRLAQNRRQRPPPPPCQSESRAPAPHRPRLQSCPKRERPRRQSCRPGPS